MINISEQEITSHWSTEDKPSVSCCCITYNHEKFINSCLDSILSQKTTFPFELIIRDDHSDDKTVDIIKQYAEKYPKIIKPIYESENQYSRGQRPFPATVKNAVGKYIATIDGDDYWTDYYKLQKQFNFLESNSGYSISYHNASEIDEDGNLITENKYVNLMSYEADTLVCGAPPILFSTAMFKNIGESLYPDKFRSIPNGDTSIWHLLGFHGNGAYQHDIKNTVYRVHPKGIWSGLTESNRLKNSLITMKLLRENLPNDKQLKNKMNDTIYKYYMRLFSALIKTRNYSLILQHSIDIIGDRDLSFVKLIYNKIKG